MMSSGGSSSDSEAEGELDKQVTDIEATVSVMTVMLFYSN